MSGIIDLHVHTTASDGSLTPSELIRHACSKGLVAIAITDHDTINGLQEAVEEGKDTGIEVIRGVEIGVEFTPEMHLLGYFKNEPGTKLQTVLNELREKRYERNPKIIRKLNEMGMDITYENVLEEAQGSVVGRPHIASVMVRKGYVGGIADAFSQYLAFGKPAFVKKDKLQPEEGIRVIIEAGGVPVLAHPTYLNLDIEKLDLLVSELVKAGLRGIEAYYPDHDKEETQKFIELAEKHNLLLTGGSDFHGSLKPEIEIGIGSGNLNVPFELLGKLLKY